MNHTQAPESLESGKNVHPKTVKRTRWMKDISEGDNLYLLGCLARFFTNIVVHCPVRISDSDTFKPIQYLMTREKVLELFDSCTTEEMRIAMRQERRYGHICEPEQEAPRELLSALWKHPKSNPKFRRRMKDWLEYATSTLDSWQNERPDPVKARIDELQHLFALSSPEVEVLTLEIVLANGMWNTDDFRKPNLFQKAALHSRLLNIPEKNYIQLVGPNSSLRRMGCLDRQGTFNTDLLTFLTGMDSAPLSNRFYKKSEIPSLPWSFFGNLAETDGTLLKQMIASRQTNQGMNILLYGEPGTGKTSFAISLAAELGLTPYFIAHCETEAEYPRSNPRIFRFSALQVCAGQVDPTRSLLVVDEADALLSGGGASSSIDGFTSGGPMKVADKGRLNDTLDTLRLPCIWITNTPAEVLDPSNLRRFDYSIRFDALNQRQREAIWNNALTKYSLTPILDKTAATRFAAHYEASAGGIDLALRNVSAMLKMGQTLPSNAETTVNRILTTHCRLLNIRADIRTGVQSDYTLDGLNIRGDISPQQIESAVRRFLDEQTAGTSNDPDHPRMNLLLSGPSGTGKTEYVKYLGATIQTQVITRMGSDLLSKYVGGTEQNIRQAFNQAASEHAILFLDEADGLFQSREHAERSWEVTQVNELLHAMENFDGVLVCATNFAIRLDSATLRRFTFKLEFDYLTTEGKHHFFQRMFASLGANGLTAEDELRLTRIPNLTPGDYRTVRQSLYYLGDEATADRLLSALERESASKRGGAAPTIGFKQASITM